MNGTRRRAWFVLAALFLGAGCRVERAPALSPFSADAGALDDIVDEPRDPPAHGGAPAAGSAGAGGSVASNAGGAAGSATSDAGGAGGAGDEASSGTAGAGGTAGDPFEADASVIVPAGGSCRPDVLECNPVTNAGCPPTMQCAVDLGSDMLAGYCVFSTPMPGGCFNSGLTESCPPTETCFEFECRTLCFCDDDCKEGQCCVDPVGTLGFKVCGDC